MDGSNAKKQPAVAHPIKDALKDLLLSAKTVSENPAFRSFLRDIDSVSGLQEEIKQRRQRENGLEMSRLKALEDYNSQRDTWKAETQRLEKRIKILQQEDEKSKETIVSLKADQDKQLKRIDDLEQLTARQKEAAEHKRKEYQGLVRAIEAERIARVKAETSVKEQEAHVSQINAAKKELEKAHSSIQNELDWNKQELQAAAELTVTLHDDGKVLERMDKIWSDAATACMAFWRDWNLEGNETEAFWVRLDQLGQLRTSIPIPHSNSPAAKQMRCAVIMASLARRFAHHLFQPTYFLSEDSGMREILMRQSEAHSAKEAAIRGHLQALLPDHQDAACSKRIQTACESVLRLVAGLLPPSEEAKFQKHLKNIADEACNVWREISCFTEAVEWRFEMWNYNNWTWGELVFDGSRCQISPRDPSGDRTENVLTIFPRLFTWENGQPQPESHGVVFTKKHIQAALDEVERISSSPRLEKSRTVRDRLSGHRRSSSGAQAAQTILGVHPFLGAKS